MPVNVKDLPAETRKRLGLRKPRETKTPRLKLDEVRREAIGVLNQIRHLSADQRRRVLEHALKVNEV